MVSLRKELRERHRRPNVIALSFAAFFNDMGADMLFAFYPLFFVIVLGIQEMKLLGLIQSIALLFGLVIRPLVGRLADTGGRRRFIWGGYLCLSVSRVGQGFAQLWYHLVPPKVLYEMGRGMRNPAREALLSDSVPPEERGYAFGLLKSMDTVGAIIGPLLGLGLFSIFTAAGIATGLRYRLVFFISASFTLISIAIILKKTTEVKPDSTAVRPEPREVRKRRFSPLLEDRRLLVFTVISGIFAFWAVSENFMLVCAAKILALTPEQVWPAVILYWFINVTFAPFALGSGFLSDRFGRKIFLVVSFLILAGLTGAFAFVRSFWPIALLFALHGIYQGFLSPSQTAFVADLAVPDRRAETLGSYSMVVGMCAIPGPLIFGLFWDTFNWRVPFLISGAAVAVCAVLLIFLLSEKGDASADDAGMTLPEKQ